MLTQQSAGDTPKLSVTCKNSRTNITAGHNGSGAPYDVLSGPKPWATHEELLSADSVMIGRNFTGLAVGLALAFVAADPTRAQIGPDQAIESCRAIPDSEARLRCYERAIGSAAPASRTAVPSAWRLIRTPHPQGGRDAVSVMRTADLARSDIDLAGLMLSCADPGVDMLIVVVTPFAPRARPIVTVTADGRDWPFAATVVPPGAELRLPPEAASLAASVWQDTREMTVKISSDGSRVEGVIVTEGLGRALAALQANCPSR
jgi:hypothetical protein